jgi:flagellin
VRINNNATAAGAQRNLSRTNDMISRNVEKLSTGQRINKAGDDASGLVISNRLRSQQSGLRQAMRNSQDAISVLQTAEGSLEQVNIMLNRIRDLTVQASNSGTNDLSARQAGQAEISELTAEITRIAGATKFGSLNLLDGSFGTTPAKITGFDVDNSYTTVAANTIIVNANALGNITVTVPTLTAATGASSASQLQTAIRAAFAAGSAAQQALVDKIFVTSATVGAGSALTLEIGGLTSGQTFTIANGTGTPLAALGLGTTVTAASGAGGLFQVGANAGETLSVAFQNFDAATLGVSTLDVTTDTGAAAALVAVDTAINTVSLKRGELGAKQNRFESMIANLEVTTENIASSESRIRDTDMAAEMVQFTKNQILSQAGTAMLAQANQIPQSILSLLKG